MINWINQSIIDLLIGVGIFLMQNYLAVFIFTFAIHWCLFIVMIEEYKEGKTNWETSEYNRNWVLIKEEQGWFFLYELLFESPFPFTAPDIPFLNWSIEGASVWNMEVFALSFWVWVIVAIVL